VRLPAALLLAVAGAVAITPISVGDVPGKIRVKTTKRDIEAVGMDGPMVVYDLHASGAGCNQVYVWNVNTNGGMIVSGGGTCDADNSSTGAGVVGIGVAGTRLAWIANSGGNTESDDDLYTSSVVAPKERHLLFAMRTGDVDQGMLDGDWIRGVYGDRDLLAVSTWSTRRGTVSRGALRLVGQARTTTIARGDRAIVCVAVGGNRIATAPGDGTVRLYSASGRLLHTYPAGDARTAALTGERLIVATAGGLRVYGTGPLGRLLATWPTPAHTDLVDAEGDLAVYSLGGRVFALRISTGKTALLVSAPRRIVGLQIERAGVVYAYNTTAGGRLVLTPTSHVESRLG
jgi:hypothetical protein